MTTADACAPPRAHTIANGTKEHAGVGAQRAGPMKTAWERRGAGGSAERAAVSGWYASLFLCQFELISSILLL
jgi:hypothetical protein